VKTVAKLSLIVALGFGVMARAEDAKKFDASKLEGKWTYVSGKKAGEDSAKESLMGTVEITKDKFAIPGPEMKPMAIGYKLDTKESPVQIDLEILDGMFKGGKAEGIIELKGDELKFCYTMKMGDAKRPTKFESTKDNAAFYFVLKRKK
jgi:uncharacterized protein (TIGR03067 family)